MANVFIVSQTDGYETFGVKGYSKMELAHFEACKRSQSWHDYTSLRICNEGDTTVYLSYVCGGYTQSWSPPEPEEITE